MQIVKYRWRNAHGVPFVDWALMLDKPADQITVPFGHGKVSDFEVLDTHPLPEAIRRTGYGGLYKARVVLKMRGSADHDIAASEFVRRIEVMACTV